MINNLGKFSSILRGVNLIVGIGLCSNIYVIGEKEITLVDTGVGDSANRLAPKFGWLNLDLKNVKQVILTHAHHDHVGGLLEVAQESQPEIFIHRLDAEYLWKLGKIVELNDGDNIETETMALKVIHTPGHTAGSMCLYNMKNKVLFSGDTVFPGGVFGRVDLSSSSGLKDMISSLKKLSKLDVEILLPGHEEPFYSDANVHIKAALKVAEEYQ